MDFLQVYCSLISSALAHREWRESSWRASLTWSLHAQTHCGKNQGLDGVLLGELNRVFVSFLSGCTLCPVVHQAFYGGSAVPGKKERIVVWGQSQKQTCSLLRCGDIWGFRQECSVTLSRLLGAPATQSWTSTPCAWQPALGNCVWVSRQTCAA